jgi:predicted DNA-binding transcriptional regulator YafY
MFEIIQLIRSAKTPKTAEWIAQELEVTKRTIYRDIASLQAMRIPIEGEAGIGYIMRPGFDLPPINFDIEEAEALTVGLSMIARSGDSGLIKAAASAARKLSEAAPQNDALLSSSWGPSEPITVDMSFIRTAIRQECKLSIAYMDVDCQASERHIQPIAMIYYTEALVLAAWCELRGDFRHFRVDRITHCEMLEEHFKGKGETLRRKWADIHAGEL